MQLLATATALTAMIGVGFATELFRITPIKQCEGSTAIKSVEVENCKDSSLCQLIRGKNYTVKVTIDAPKDTKNVKVLLTGVVAEAELPFPGLNRYLCKEPVNSKFCPQEKGKEYTATINMPILALFPKLKTTAYMRFIDDDASSAAEEKLACFELPVELIDDPNAPVNQKAASDDTDDDE